MTYTKKCYISKSVKKKKLSPAEKVGNILAFDKESKRRLVSLSSIDSFIKKNLLYHFRVEFFLCLNKKFCDFKKSLFRYYEFSVAVNKFL